MAIDIKQLRQHFSSLSDEGLRQISRNDLVGEAQRCYDEELARRNAERPGPSGPARPLSVQAEEPDENWEEHAACVCSFNDHPGQHTGGEAEEARQALDAAGIPCSVSFTPAEHDQPGEWRVLVPAARELHAVSVLDCEIFNPKTEATWRSHLELLSDNELAALNVDAICAGLLDRAERLRNAYLDELDNRGLSSPDR